MGLFDDLFELPSRAIEAVVGVTAAVAAATLMLPLTVTEAAMKAGCKTMEEIEAWADRMTD